MAARTEAQEEFDALVAKQSALEIGRSHPEDRRDEEVKSEDDEETTFRKKEVDDTMRLPAFDMRSGGFGFKLPDKSFDNESRTGVKGVIADARSYEEARRKGNRINGGKASGNGMVNNTAQSRRDDRARKTTSYLHSDSEDDETSPLEADTDDEDFLARWREARRLEIENEVGAGKDIRTRRTSPSARRYGRFDEVDALGYLDAIEKVGRETKVVVFVYDHEVCCVTVPYRMLSLTFLFYLVPCLRCHRGSHRTSRCPEPNHSLRPRTLRGD